VADASQSSQRREVVGISRVTGIQDYIRNLRGVQSSSKTKKSCTSAGGQFRSTEPGQPGGSESKASWMCDISSYSRYLNWKDGSMYYVRMSPMKWSVRFGRRPLLCALSHGERSVHANKGHARAMMEANKAILTFASLL
jgi:hypothetical protein